MKPKDEEINLRRQIIKDAFERGFRVGFDLAKEDLWGTAEDALEDYVLCRIAEMFIEDGNESST